MKKFIAFYIAISLFIVLALFETRSCDDRLILPDKIFKIEVTYHTNGHLAASWILDAEETQSLIEWASCLVLSAPKTFNNREAPNETNCSGESWTFNINNEECQFYYLSIDENYIVVNEQWFVVFNPSDPPINNPYIQ